MKNNLRNLLPSKYVLSGSDTRLEITDRTIQGYDPRRNIAKVEVRGGKIFVNVYKGYFYKPGEFVEVASVEEAASLIKKGR